MCVCILGVPGAGAGDGFSAATEVISRENLDFPSMGRMVNRCQFFAGILQPTTLLVIGT